jgi:hypothetical protein
MKPRMIYLNTHQDEQQGSIRSLKLLFGDEIYIYLRNGERDLYLCAAA